MIIPLNLEPHHIGRYVIFNDGKRPPQRGRIKSYTDYRIFVVFHWDENPDEFMLYTAAGCLPEHLSFEEGTYD